MPAFKKLFSHVAVAALMCGALAGCDMYHEGTITEKRVQVTEEKITQEIPLSELTEGTVVGLSRHYEKHGDGPVDMAIAYDPHSKKNTAMHATQEMTRLVKEFNNQGVQQIKADILPVRDLGDEPVVILSYLSYTASAPEGCGTMPGISDTDITYKNEDYRMGCTLEGLYARQAARPRDLLGRGAEDPHGDGRRASNIGEIYRSGQPNEPLDGETASE